MNGKTTTVKEPKEFLADKPDNAPVFRVETVNEDPNASYLLVLHVWEESGQIMID